MSHYQEILLSLIDSPPQPMRGDSFYEGLPELIASIAEEGLHQPVGLLVQEDNRYQVIFGHRRCAAVQELRWETIPAIIFQPGEVDTDTAMGSENFQRSQVNMAEEARFYRRMVEERGMSQAEISRRWKRPPQRVGQLLQSLEGDPAVVEALGAGDISLAQAVEINKIKDDYGREHALHFAAHDQLSAQNIRLWAEQREISGVSASIQELKEQGQQEGAINYRTQIQCCLCQEWPQIENAMHRMMCNDCWNETVMLREAYQAQLKQMQAGEGQTTEEGH